MKKPVKALSVVLILAALFGLVAGGMTVKDVMDCKAYWEQKSVESNENLAMLEDGLNTLRENESTYYEGRETYEQGVKDYESGKQELADGQTEYNAGVQTLQEKQAEYEAGLATLKAAEQKLAAGQKEYDAGVKAYEAGLAQIETFETSEQTLTLLGSSLQSAKAGLENYGDLQTAMGSEAFKALAAQGHELNALAAEFAAKYKVDPTNEAAVQQAIAAQVDQEKVKQDVAAKIAKEHSADIGKIAAEEGVTQEQATLIWMASNQETVAEYQEAAINAQIVKMQIYKDSVVLNEKKEALESEPNRQLMAGAQGTLKSLGSNMSTAVAGFTQLAPDKAEEFAELQPLLGAVNACASAQNVASFLTAAQALQGSMGSGDPLAQLEPMLKEYEGVYTEGMKELEANRPAYEAGKAALPAAEKKLTAAKAALDAGYAEYNAGKAKLDDGAVQLAAGRAQLQEAEKTIAEGKTALADAEKQLEDGKAKLQEFEDGRDQICAGLETLKATETYAGLQSIADRLGADFDYMKNEFDLDIDQGMAALAAAREFSADNGAAVTRELTTRAVAGVLAIAGSVLALLAGILGLTGKVKGSGVLAVISAIGAAAAIVAAVMAGSELSAVAGSTTAFLALAGGAVVAVLALIQAISSLSPAKAAAE